MCDNYRVHDVNTLLQCDFLCKKTDSIEKNPPPLEDLFANYFRILPLVIYIGCAYKNVFKMSPWQMIYHRNRIVNLST